jgi:hypothetical protein
MDRMKFGFVKLIFNMACNFINRDPGIGAVPGHNGCPDGYLMRDRSFLKSVITGGGDCQNAGEVTLT